MGKAAAFVSYDLISRLSRASRRPLAGKEGGGAAHNIAERVCIAVARKSMRFF
jgi:hypothetical protein